LTEHRYVYVVIKQNCDDEWFVHPEIQKCFEHYEDASRYCESIYNGTSIEGKSYISLGIRRFIYE
jgi:hypothetical protein